MKIREMYTEAIKGELEWLAIMIEFLVFEKEVLQMDDHRDAIDFYFKENNRKRMTELLLEYREEMGE